MANEYDVVVIGSGTGGYVAAIRAGQLGLKTACVERAPVLGGTCLNWGCIPTKALLEHAHALKIAQDWKEWGLTIGQAAIGLDMGQVQSRKDRIVKGLTGGIELLYFANLVMMMFGAKMPFLHESNWIGIGINVVVVIVAALNLVLDFDFIEEGAQRGAPKYMEWYAGYGLLVTLVWLYVEFLRLLSKLNSRN